MAYKEEKLKGAAEKELGNVDWNNPESTNHAMGFIDGFVIGVKSESAKEYHLPKTKSMDDLMENFFKEASTGNFGKISDNNWPKVFMWFQKHINNILYNKSDIWLNINDEQPIYYTPFLCQLTSLDYVVLWRANNGSYDVYTVNKGDTVYLSKDILKWKKLESPNPKP